MNTQLPGGTPPKRRLAVTLPFDKANGSAVRSLLKVSPRFPFGAPSWPGGVPLPPAERELGVHYDSDWARSPLARISRSVIQTSLTNPVVRAITSPTVRGLDRVAHLDEPVIFAANHSSHLDAPLLMAVIPQRWRDELFVAGAADYFFDTKLKAVMSALTLNAVPMERQRVSRTSARRATELLDDGWSMLIFPEGGRSPDGWGQAHRAGAAWLAIRSEKPVIPLYVEGTGRILPKGARRVKTGKVTVNFGAPMFPPADGDARAFATAIEDSIAALADELVSDWYASRLRAGVSATPTLSGPDAPAWRRSWALTRTKSGGGASSSTKGWPWTAPR